MSLADQRRLERQGHPNDAPMHAPPLLVMAAKELGPYVRQVRKDQGLRIDDAASLFGLSVDTLSRLENGVGAVRTDKLLAVLDGLGLALLVGKKDEVAGIVRELQGQHDAQ